MVQPNDDLAGLRQQKEVAQIVFRRAGVLSEMFLSLLWRLAGRGFFGVLSSVGMVLNLLCAAVAARFLDYPMYRLGTSP